MSVFLVLIPVSVGLAAAFVVLCLLSIRGGQFDDLESPRWRILFDGAPAGMREAAKMTEPIPPVPHPSPFPRKHDEAHPV